MEFADVNVLAKREVKDGSRYNKYFSPSGCKPVFLGNGDTFVTIAQMKKWAIKHKGQTKKLALSEFSGFSLQQTAEKIYSFLYDHFQYELDGNRQNLKTPDCAWATRHEGTDCKTYSVFASTILQNLGIGHYLRKVKQPRLIPDKWTHVYVVVPKDQRSLKTEFGYYIIDATVKPNQEVEFTQKHDVLMPKVSLPHFGLQSPAIVGMGACSCTARPPAPTRTLTTLPTATTPIRTIVQTALRAGVPLREEEAFERAVVRFKEFLKQMRGRGLNAQQEEFALRNLQNFINIGKEPTLLELFMPVQATTGLGMIEGDLLLSTNQLPLSSSARTATTRSSAASTVGSIANVATGGGFGQVTGVLSLVTSIIPKEIFEKTFGALFANGFNFKCWGASWNPDRAEKTLVEEIPILLERATAVLRVPFTQYEKAVNDFMVFFYSVRAPERHWLSDNAKDCTKDGLRVLIGGLDNVKIKIKAAFEEHARLNGNAVNLTTTVRKTYPPFSNGNHSLVQDVEQYKLTINNSNTIPANQTAVNTIRGNVTIRGQVPTGTTTTSTRTPSATQGTAANISNIAPQQAGFGTITGIALGAIALGTIFFSIQQNKKNN